MPAEGSRRAADVLRLPGRALGSLANDEPDRIDVRDDSASSSKDQRQRHPTSKLGDDVQARSISLQEMETTRTATRRSHSSSKDGPSKTESCRKKSPLNSRTQNTTIDNCSSPTRRSRMFIGSVLPRFLLKYTLGRCRIVSFGTLIANEFRVK